MKLILLLSVLTASCRHLQGNAFFFSLSFFFLSTNLSCLFAAFSLPENCVSARAGSDEAQVQADSESPKGHMQSGYDRADRGESAGSVMAY